MCAHVPQCRFRLFPPCCVPATDALSFTNCLAEHFHRGGCASGIDEGPEPQHHTTVSAVLRYTAQSRALLMCHAFVYLGRVAPQSLHVPQAVTGSARACKRSLVTRPRHSGHDAPSQARCTFHWVLYTWPMWPASISCLLIDAAPSFARFRESTLL